MKLYKNQHLLLLLIGLFMGVSVHAQSLRLKKADEYFEEFSYDKAIKNYEALADKDAHVYRNLAKSYLMLNDTDKAEENYANLMSTGQYKPEDVYNYAAILLMNKKYDQAANWMQKYYKLKPSDRRARLFMEDPMYYRDLIKPDPNVKLTDEEINSKFEDFSPVYYKNDQVVFASSRDHSFLINRKWNGNRQPYLDLYVADLTQGNHLTNVRKFDKHINQKYHDAPATFNAKGDYMVITRNIYDKKKLQENRLQLYDSHLQSDGHWSTPRKLHFNNEQYNYGQASMTPDGQLMYFTSDKPGGFGGTDIYKVSRKPDGTWGDPENVGDQINTEGNEMFPYFDPKGGYLFYSSNGLPGLGGLDIFVSKIRKDGKTYTKPLNLGAPMNSNKDDFSFIYKENGSGFLSSNREGGKGDDDIYSFKTFESFKDKVQDCYLSGTITDKDTELPLSDAQVVLYDNQGKTLSQAITGKDGRYEFPIDCGSTYKVVVSRDKYNGEEAVVDTKNFGSQVIKDFALQRPESYLQEQLCKIQLEPIYYDLDKFYIRIGDKVKLDRILKLMEKYPKMRLEVASHTDARASKAYNIRLSKNRTQSVVDYLTSHGVSPDRIEAKWFGEQFPVNGCVDGVKCSEDEHQLNRRTEFKILDCDQKEKASQE